jgi:ATP-binding cassette, subfamily C, bacterial CydCD
VTGSPRSANRSPRLGLDRRDRRRALVAIGVGLVGEFAALGLLTTGAWLLLSASLRPPILLLSIAIGAVQLFSFLRGTARYVERLASHSLGLGLQAGLRTWLYRRLAQLLPCGLPGGDRGDLLTRLIRDTEEAQDLVVRAAVPVLAAVAAWAAAVVTAIVLLPTAGWAILAAGILAAAGTAATAVLVGRRAATLPAARGSVASWALGALTAREELAALGAGQWALDQLAGRERVLGARTRAAATATGLGRAVCALAGGAGLAGVAWTGAAALRAGRTGPVEFGVLVFLALGVAAVFQGLPDAVGRLPVSLASLTRLRSLGSPVPRPPADAPAHEPRPAPGACRTVTVALRGAAVAYPNRPGRMLRDLDLELAPGRPVALAGPSGSGKTLVVFTLLRFLDLSGGHLSIDGTDVRACPPGEVRALLAWSPEQPTLFPASLRANLRVGAPHATDRQVTDLLRQLGLGPWLDRLEQGLDTVLAPWGHQVSGGELQRLSVARAVLADRPVLLLDEPTRHLDAATADAVLQAVLDRAAGRSLLWITHRRDELGAFPEVRHLGADPECIGTGCRNRQLAGWEPSHREDDGRKAPAAVRDKKQ